MPYCDLSTTPAQPLPPGLRFLVPDIPQRGYLKQDSAGSLACSLNPVCSVANRGSSGGDFTSPLQPSILPGGRTSPMADTSLYPGYSAEYIWTSLFLDGSFGVRWQRNRGEDLIKVPQRESPFWERCH
ncbi:Hypothetical predicted protein [Pelobates cultripes]|uniref:Uncharacterized protein n=1 Tax=Pelobates cultripes TaxID=61616 RepID=A0AAD1R0T9_PELCU|nr:Hypothetical predicted protein [Pelobates cultripes]